MICVGIDKGLLLLGLCFCMSWWEIADKWYNGVNFSFWSAYCKLRVFKKLTPLPQQSIKTNHFELAIQQAGSLLNHDRSSLRLAALRTLIQAAQFDNKVFVLLWCFVAHYSSPPLWPFQLRFPHTKIEVCIRDKNKTVASLAVTLLLQVCGL